MKRKLSSIGLMAGVLSIIPWIIFSFFNPYLNQVEGGTILLTFGMLVLPSCLAIASFLLSKKVLMLIAFAWSLPISLYLLMAPGVFLLFGVTSFSYLISFIFMMKSPRGYNP
ncbi:hypothetical protein FITA111629_13945 [Filibacter tadaridae]|uniref:Uncharacterized protein n=1 Tax=Filibacter tadaridae TaxID=2483811 RepID=A0A3P5WV83_9BACL|nr:hypothetical protein [Filibacter tadaridae]VDC22386.1 hypothetical protein FILTAD_00732 [Filibacter tadaridae]